MHDINYTLVRRRKIISNITISVSSKGVKVTAPFWTPKSVIDAFVMSKTKWIEKHTKKYHAEKQNRSKRGYQMFLGKEYKLVCLVDSSNSLPQIKLEGNSLVISSKYPLDSKTSKRLLLSWYRENGAEIFTDRLNFYSKKMGVTYQKMTIKIVSSIWGSCSKDNKISLNWALIKTPLEIIDYVIVHELSHIIHKNHSSNFWATVEKYCPDYKTHRKWLRQYQLRLLNDYD